MASLLYYVFCVPFAVGVFMVMYGLMGWRWNRFGRPGGGGPGFFENNYERLLRTGVVLVVVSLPLVLLLGFIVRRDGP